MQNRLTYGNMLNPLFTVILIIYKLTIKKGSGGGSYN